MRLYVIRRFVIVLCLPIQLLLSGPAAAVDLGLTPSHVYSLWTNINNALVASARTVDPDTQLISQMVTMHPVPVSGKVPGDVLHQVQIFRETLNLIRAAQGLSHIEVFRNPEGEVVTPSVVFLNSGNVLDGLVDWFARNADKDELLSSYYRYHGFRDKTPSDVFGMVVLASQRLSVLRARAERLRMEGGQ